MKPALTAEEWNREGSFDLSDADLRRGAALGALANNFAGAAAICLYGQPFGFTREDVALLRWVVNYRDDIKTGLASIAERIEALLPPAPPNGRSVTSKQRTA